MNFDVIRSAKLKFDPKCYALASGLCKGLVSDADLDKFAAMMQNRCAVGETRYEGSKWLYFDRDQEETIGKNWRYGFTFYDWDPALYRAALHRKSAAYEKTGNTEFLVDMANYWMFLWLTDESFRAELAPVGVSWAIREFFNPTHKDAHYRAYDQGIDGDDASGSASNDPRVQARMRAVAR